MDPSQSRDLRSENGRYKLNPTCVISFELARQHVEIREGGGERKSKLFFRAQVSHNEFWLQNPPNELCSVCVEFYSPHLQH